MLRIIAECSISNNKPHKLPYWREDKKQSERGVVFHPIDRYPMLDLFAKGIIMSMVFTKASCFRTCWPMVFFEKVKQIKNKRTALRVLHLERKFPSNTETFIVNQINALPQCEHSMFTIDFLDKLPSIAKVYSPPSIPFLSDKFLRNRQISYFKNQISQIKPDLIHAHYITDASVFHKVTRNLNVPKICSCYGYDVSVVPVKFKYFYKYFYEPIIDEYDVFLAMTDEMKNDMLDMGLPENKIKVHYHGIDTKKFDSDRNYNLSDGKIQILTIASLFEVKGHETVLRALARIKNEMPELKFHYDVVGDGTLMAVLEKLGRSLGLNDNITFHGYIDQDNGMREIMQKADVIAHPSVLTKENDKEGIPGAIVEAMASGLPVISTYHGGIPFVVHDKETGFLIKEKDDRAMADIIVKLYDDNLRKRIGQQAKTYAQEHLDLYKKAEDLEQMYKSLV